MIQRKNPLINQNELPTPADYVIETEKEGYTFAFALEHWETGPKTDPRYVQWTVVASRKEDDGHPHYFYPVRVCTDEDFAKFYEIEARSQNKVQKLRDQKAFYCLDYSLKDFDLYGNWRTDDYYTHIEPAIFPCATRLEFHDRTTSGGHDECEWDQKAVQKYLGNGPSMFVLQNSGALVSDEYG